MSERDIFTAARALTDPAARSAYLNGACDGDAELRSRVEALLRAHDRPDSLLDRPAPAPHDPEATAALAAGHASDAGAGDDESLTFLEPATRPDALGRLGHYEVLQVLGRGAFGIVFRAFDDVLQRVVAVKVLAPQLAATSPARKRFLREARSSAAVRHENVVQVYEVGDHPLPYLAMEFIPGETLQDRLNRTGPLDVLEVVRLGRQIAEGLAAAHATDLIHRDIKPSNILIEGGQQKAKLTDFGLARAADDASISQSGIIVGTPMYMAPEQAQGAKLDQRADLFSLGSVLYQMASGRPPFRANSTLAVLKRVAEDTPRDIREIIPEAPPWLCNLIAKLHAKKPEDRYQSAREVADVLADCEQQLKAHGALKDFSRIPGGQPAPRATRRWRWAAALVLLLPLLAWGAYSLTRPGSNPERLAPALPPQSAASEEGWVQLFNGTDLTGWKRHDKWPGEWGVEDGVLVGRGMTYLLSERNYSDFHLRAEMRCSGGCAVLFRVPSASPEYLSGLVASASPLLLAKANPNWDEIARANGVPDGKWFTLDLHTVGEQITIHVDGKLVIDKRVSGFTKGQLALHAHMQGEVRFRKVEVKELTPASSPAVPQKAADVLPYLAGSWMVEMVQLVPKLPPGTVSPARPLTFDYVAAGSLLRGRSAAVEGLGDIRFLFSFDPDKNLLRQWQAWFNGNAHGPFIGLFNPDNRTLQWRHKLGNGIESFNQFDFVDANTIKTHLFHQDASNTIVREMSMTFTRIQGPVAVSTRPPDPKRPDEAKVLDRMVGEWQNEQTVIDAATPDKPKREMFRMKAESILGGRFVEMTETSEATGDSDYTLAWYDADRKQYREWFFHGRGYVLEFTGTWDDAANTLTWQSPDKRLEGRWVFKSDDRREFRHLTKAADGKVLNEAVGVSVRQRRDVPRTATEFLPFIQGTWKGEGVVIEPKLPPEKAQVFRHLTFTPVSGGKVMRGVAVNQQGEWTSLVLHSYDAATDRLNNWFFSPDGDATHSSAGVFNPSNRTYLWMERLPDGKQYVQQLEFVDANTVQSRIYEMDANNKIVSEVRTKFTRDNRPAPPPKHEVDPQRPAEMKVLDRLVGEWREELTVKRAAAPNEPKVETVRLKAESILGGRIVEIVETNETKNTSDYWLTWFDPSSKRYRTWYFANDGTIGEPTTTWKEATKTLTWTSSDGTLSGRYVFQSDDQREVTYLVKDEDGNVLTESTGVARRVATGWRPLFNGKDLTGWKQNEKAQGDWKVRDGNLTCGGGACSYLFTERDDFANFHLRAEARLNQGGDSGIFFRSRLDPLVRYKEVPHPNPAGYEVQIASLAENRTGSLWAFGDDLKRPPLTRETELVLPPDEWFTLEVVANGRRLQVFVNGQKRADVEHDQYGRGHLALQHLGEKTAVLFRKIEIKELPGAPSAGN